MTKEEVKQLSEAEKRRLAMQNAWGTSFTICPKCGIYKERRYVCWNCDFDE